MSDKETYSHSLKKGTLCKRALKNLLELMKSKGMRVEFGI